MIVCSRRCYTAHAASSQSSCMRHHLGKRVRAIPTAKATFASTVCAAITHAATALLIAKRVAWLRGRRAMERVRSCRRRKLAAMPVMCATLQKPAMGRTERARSMAFRLRGLSVGRRSTAAIRRTYAMECTAHAETMCGSPTIHLAKAVCADAVRVSATSMRRSRPLSFVVVGAAAPRRWSQARSRLLCGFWRGNENAESVQAAVS